MNKELRLAQPVHPTATSSGKVPSDGFCLVVDGQIKLHFRDEEAACKAGAHLLGKHPRLQVGVYDAATKSRSGLT